MRPLKLSLTGLALLIAGNITSHAADVWSVDMRVSEACTCNSLCPCLFNSAPTQGFCHVNWLAEIKKGRYGTQKLDGLTVVCVEEMGKWRKCYVTDHATQEQAAALAALLGSIPIYAVKEVRSVQRVPLKIEKSSGRISFSTPASEDEIEVTKGVDGKEVVVKNLPVENLVVYTSLKHTYHGGDSNFDTKGTHGATFRVRASSDDPKPTSP